MAPLPPSVLSAALGRPYYSSAHTALHAGDSLELLVRLPSESVRMILTSPPYFGIDKGYPQPRCFADYLLFGRRLLEECHRILTPDGALLLNLGYATVPGRGDNFPLFYEWDRHGQPFWLKQELIWHPGSAFGCYRRSHAIRTDRWYWLIKSEDAPYLRQMDAARFPMKHPEQFVRNPDGGRRNRCNSLGKTTDVWEIPREKRSERIHPTQWPAEIARRLIGVSSMEGDTILDPFAGSAAALLEAAQLGRFGLGIELHPPHIAAAAARLARSSRE